MESLIIAALVLGFAFVVAVVGMLFAFKRLTRRRGACALFLGGVTAAVAGWWLYANWPDERLEVRPSTYTSRGGLFGPTIAGDCDAKLLILKNIGPKAVEVRGIVVNGEYRLHNRFKGGPVSEKLFSMPLTESREAEFPLTLAPNEEVAFLVWVREGALKSGYEQDIGLVEIKTRYGQKRYTLGPLSP